jgi:hypothetical protein
MLPDQRCVLNSCRAAADGCGTGGLEAYFSRKCAANWPNVFGALAQWRNFEGECGEAVVQIFAELPFPHEREEMGVRGGDDAGIHAHNFGAAETLQFFLLEKTEQLGLKAQWHLADLIEKQRASLRSLNSSRVGLCGSGKTSRAWPKSSASFTSGGFCKQEAFSAGGKFSRDLSCGRREIASCYLVMAVTSRPISQPGPVHRFLF